MLKQQSPGIDKVVEQFIQSLSEAILMDVRIRADAALQGVHSESGGEGQPVRRRDRPARSASRRLQGVYLGKLRRLRGRDRTRVRTVARKEGVAAAVALAQRILTPRAK